MVLESPIFGRADALAELTGALDRANAGRGSYLVVTGEAGIGKTRLHFDALGNKYLQVLTNYSPIASVNVQEDYITF